MNLFLEKIRNFFRKKFNIVRAKTAIAGIKSLIHIYDKQERRLNVEMSNLYDQTLHCKEMKKKYNSMLEDLKEELNNGKV